MSTSHSDSEYFIIQKLSEYLEIKVSTLYSLVAQKKIPHYRVGRLVRFKKSEIDIWMDGNKKECVDVPRAARRILRATRGPTRDISPVVKKAIHDARGTAYTASHRKPDQVKGHGKEVPDGTV
jgi:excisionase family DNA binding protein